MTNLLEEDDFIRGLEVAVCWAWRWRSTLLLELVFLGSLRYDMMLMFPSCESSSRRDRQGREAWTPTELTRSGGGCCFSGFDFFNDFFDFFADFGFFVGLAEGSGGLAVVEGVEPSPDEEA